MRSLIEYTRLNEFVIIVLAYIVGYLVVDFIVAPVQHLFVAETSWRVVYCLSRMASVSLRYGFAVLRAILPLIAAECLVAYFYGKPDVGLDVFLGLRWLEACAFT